MTERNRAEEANRAKDEFLSMLAHELRNPLNAILGWTAILRDRSLPADRMNHAFEVIQRNARLAADLVDALLDLSRMTSGKLKLESEPLDLLAVVRALVESSRPAADAKGVTLTLIEPSDSIVLTGDSARLQQAFSNLIANSIELTPQGGRVDVLLARTDAHATIQVLDNGERTSAGPSLEMAIVQELVRLHGGTIAAESQGKGKGSRVTVTLPISAT